MGEDEHLEAAYEDRFHDPDYSVRPTFEDDDYSDEYEDEDDE